MAHSPIAVGEEGKRTFPWYILVAVLVPSLVGLGIGGGLHFMVRKESSLQTTFEVRLLGLACMGNGSGLWWVTVREVKNALGSEGDPRKNQHNRGTPTTEHR